MIANTWRSLTNALRSPGFSAVKDSIAEASKVMFSDLRTFRAIFCRADLLTRLNLITSRKRENRSLVDLQEAFLPHRPISSLHARITGCLVIFKRCNNSALPPESPLSRLALSSPVISSFTLASEIARRPPVR